MGAAEDAAAWGVASKDEPRWPASLAVLVASALYVTLPSRLTVGLGPHWVLPIFEVVLVGALMIVSPHRVEGEPFGLRLAAVLIIALITIANVVSLGELIHALLTSSQLGGHARVLVYASVPVWVTNVLVFGLWYWELDRGGPARRLSARHRQPDFLFPQMETPAATKPNWTPNFVDYLYTSFTNATAFSPTDTMPLTQSAKLLMMVQSLASLLTVAIVVSRAVNILN